MIKYKVLLSFALFFLYNWPGFATIYYINSQVGNDKNSGITPRAPLQSLQRVSTLKLKVGDQILLATGSVFKGMLALENIAGTTKAPILVSKYEPRGKTEQLPFPIIDAQGFSNGILLKNCSHIIVRDIEITVDGNGLANPNIPVKGMRCGVLVTTSKAGEYENIQLQNLVIQNIFFEKEGFNRGVDEVRTANGSQSYGWGIRFINRTADASLRRIRVESCKIKNVGHTGIKFTGKNKSIHDVKIYNNQVQETGGPGIQLSGVHQGHIQHNEVDRSGSKDDSRKWGRGSGLWTWGCSNIIIEHNSFRNANGPGDSAGCHIDFNCNNVIVQYNLSANNAGGFCEILGNNYNCAYRYNISINDGYRVKKQNGAFQEGKIFWLSGC